MIQFLKNRLSLYFQNIFCFCDLITSKHLLISLLLSFNFITFSQIKEITPENKKNDTILINKNAYKSIHIIIYSKTYKDSLIVNKQNITSKLDSINKSLIRKGYIYNKLIPKNIKLSDSVLYIKYIVNNLQLQKIDSIFFINDKYHFPKNVNKYIFKKYAGKKLSDNTLMAIEKTTNQCVRDIKIEKIYPTISNNSTSVVVKYKTSKNNSIEGLVGVHSENKKTLINGLIDLNLKNIFWKNENIHLFWKKDISKQNLSFGLKLPYLFGTALFANSETSFTNNNNNSFKLYSDNIVGWNFSGLSVGMNFGYNKSINNDDYTENSFIGNVLIYKFKKISVLKKIGFTNYLYNEVNYNLTKTSDFNIYNESYFGFKTGQYQYLYNGIILNYSHSNNIILKHQIKALSYKYFSSIANPELHQIALINTKYLWTKNKLNLYLSADFMLLSNQNRLSLSVNKALQGGIGMVYVNKNQILTLEVTNRLYSNYISDLQGFIINIKQQIRF